jgi:hypothetical protein
MPNKKLLIITGPQGSGNHVYSRVFSLHPDVHGWESLKDNYWIPSDEETFAEYWVEPEKITEEFFKDSTYFLANVSCPFFYNGVRQIPKIIDLADRVSSFGIDVVIAIVVRDQNINAVQQKRVGGEVTLPSAMDYYKNNILNSKHTVHFIDHEALFLWKNQYVSYLGNLFGFPVVTDESVMKFITEDANHKYVKEIDNHWLDDTIRAGRRPFNQRNTKGN